MPFFPEDYVQYVIKDIEKAFDTRKIKKAGMIERYTIHACDPKLLHANPNDEFSQTSVGPNFEIIADYVREANYDKIHNLQVFEEPIVVEKLEEEGYLILNGHHRWFAALRMRIPKVAISIVNLIHEEDMCRMINATNNDKRVVFDLREVLLSTHENDREVIVEDLLCKRIPERLRSGGAEIIRRFQEADFDVWVYTPSFNSEEYINGFFSMYNIRIDGIVNGISDKRHHRTKEALRIRRMMDEKYRCAVNIDNEGVVIINTQTKDFEQYELADAEGNWAGSVLDLIPAILEGTNEAD